jgi:serine O-acetyltransferase
MSAYLQDIAANDTRDPLLTAALTVYRFGNWIYYYVHWPIIRQLIWLCYLTMDLIIVRLCCKSIIPAQCRIGGGLKLPHGMNTIIIHRYAEIGRRVIIEGGAKVIDAVHIGDGASIGANSVVTADVPPLARAIGVPAVWTVLPNVIPMSNGSPNRQRGQRKK